MIYKTYLARKRTALENKLWQLEADKNADNNYAAREISATPNVFQQKRNKRFISSIFLIYKLLTDSPEEFTTNTISLVKQALENTFVPQVLNSIGKPLEIIKKLDLQNIKIKW